MALRRLSCRQQMAACSIIFACFAAQAQDTQAPAGSAIQYDKSGIEKIRDMGGGKLRVWYKYSFSGVTLENLIMGDHDYKSYDYSRSLLEIDCNAKRVRVASGSDYSTSGKVIYSFDKPREFAGFAAETDAGGLAKLACSQARPGGFSPPEITKK